MSKKAKLILFPILGTVGVAATVTPFAVLSIKKSNNNKITPAENSKIVNYSVTFPSLSPTNYYKFIKFDDNNIPYLENNVVSAIVKDVLSKLSDYEKDIDFDYKFVNPQMLEVYFKLNFNQNREFKTYKLEISKDKNYSKLIVH
ncbi:MHO_1590 family protein [Mycoplasmopsis bovis]|uniref:MHO_1590 family protein n=1 Tax=Mycoplasmopsis bovis TaxID=28903 RepID=UPI003F79F56C